MMMYSRLGGIEVADVDAISTCNAYPRDWTRKPWIRPDGRPDVLIPNDWMATPGPALIPLARSTYPDNGAGVAIDNPSQAFDAIAEYLASTTHPDTKPVPPIAPETPTS
jgi:hypothetical protein